MSVSFETRVYKEGINYLAEADENVISYFNPKGYVPVRGTVKNHHYKATLVPRKAGKCVLFLNQEIRNAAGIKEGELVEITLEYDPESRELPVPLDLEDALSQDISAKTGFDKFSASHKRELIVWINDAKKVETREKRITKAVEHCVEHYKNK